MSVINIFFVSLCTLPKKMESSQKKHKDAHNMPLEDVSALYRAIRSGKNDVALSILAKLDDPIDLSNIIEHTDRYITWWANNFGVPNKPPFDPTERQLGKVRYIPLYQAIYTARYGEQNVIPKNEPIDYFWLLLARYVSERFTSVVFPYNNFGDKILYAITESDGGFSYIDIDVTSYTPSHSYTNERRIDVIVRSLVLLLGPEIFDRQDFKERTYNGLWRVHKWRKFRRTDKVRADIVYILLQTGLQLEVTWRSDVKTIRSPCISCGVENVAFHIEDRPKWTFCKDCADKY